jgi:uncharacterized membrane protein
MRELVSFLELMESIGKAVDAGGVVIIVVGIALASVSALQRLSRRDSDSYETYRRRLGIIRTVAVTPTFASVGVLALIVLIRTFLSFSLELEITGRWPWQKGPNSPHPGS